MRALNVLLALLFPVLLFVALFEGGLRLMGKGPEETGLQFDQAVGWAKKPNTSYTRSGPGYSATIELNELGLRDDPMDSPAKPANTTRVLVLGDSFTLGYTVDRDALFVDLLEGWCEAEGRSVDVVNAGTQAWSTDQSIAWLEEYGREFEPDVVVLAPYDNDLYYNGQTNYSEYTKPRYDAEGFLDAGEIVDPWADGVPASKTWAIAKLLFETRTPGARFTPPGGSNPLPADFAPLFPGVGADVLGDCLERSRGVLAAAKRITDQMGAELLVAPIPSHSAVEADMAQRMSEFFGVEASSWQPSRPVELVMGWCEELGIQAADPTEALVAATKIERTEGGDIDYAASERCYLDFFENGQEWHFNERGNEVYGRFLHEQLAGRGWLPDGEREVELVAATVATSEPEGGLPTWMVVFGVLFVALSAGYISFYRDEPAPLAIAKVFALLSVIFATFLGVKWLITTLNAINPTFGMLLGAAFVIGVLGFVAYKLGNRLATIAELFKAFTLRGHWYLMPVVVILLTIGSLLVVAASSPLVAPFIYTLF